nr:immunoglobulin heavy chain junction region [Macaca mulatta]
CVREGYGGSYYFHRFDVW